MLDRVFSKYSETNVQVDSNREICFLLFFELPFSDVQYVAFSFVFSYRFCFEWQAFPLKKASLKQGKVALLRTIRFVSKRRDKYINVWIPILFFHWSIHCIIKIYVSGFRVAPESWDPLSPRVFGIFFLLFFRPKNKHISCFTISRSGKNYRTYGTFQSRRWEGLELPASACREKIRPKFAGKLLPPKKSGQKSLKNTERTVFWRKFNVIRHKNTERTVNST